MGKITGNNTMSEAEYTITVKGTYGASKALIPLLEEIKRLGDAGSSREIEIKDWETRGNKRFGFDGDGWDKIIKIELEKSKLPVDEFVTGMAFIGTTAAISPSPVPQVGLVIPHSDVIDTEEQKDNSAHRYFTKKDIEDRKPRK